MGNQALMNKHYGPKAASMYEHKNLKLCYKVFFFDDLESTFHADSKSVGGKAENFGDFRVHVKI